MHITQWQHIFFDILETLGTIVFAMSGAISASRKNYDLSSVLLIAFAVGNGGGTIRDLLIGALPVFWVQNVSCVILSALTGFVVFVIGSQLKFRGKVSLLADAIGLGVFAIAGALKTLSFNLSPVVAVMMGVLTAVGGGVIRDILCGDPLLIFKPELYATTALFGASIFVLFQLYLPQFTLLGGGFCILAIIILRLGTLHYGWHLPTSAFFNKHFIRKK